MVGVGFIQALVVKILPSIMNRLETSWVRPHRSTTEVSGSPLISNGLYYIQNETGVAFVVRPNKKELEIVSRNDLQASKDEIFRATPVSYTHIKLPPKA